MPEYQKNIRVNTIDNTCQVRQYECMKTNANTQQAQPATIKFHCGACGTTFGKTQKELNLYGLDLNCPKCNSFVDGENN